MRNEFDYTMLSTFLTCRRKYYYRMERHLIGKQPPTAAEFGRCIHTALDDWFAYHNEDKAVEVFKSVYKEDPEDDKRTYKLGEWILRNYHAKYIDQPFKTLAIEQSFDLELPSGKHYIGRMDKIIEWDGAVWVMDHKTTSQLGPTYMRFHTPNLQFDGYVWAAQKLGYKCTGVLVDAILVAKGLLDTTSRAKLVPLLRDFAPRSTQDITDFEAYVCEVQEDIHECEDSEIWYPNYNSCVDYGECPYRRICKEPVELRDRIIAADFITEKWDPRKDRK